MNLPPDLLPAETEALVRLAALDLRSNTGRTYAASLRLWGAWYILRFGRPMSLPVPGEALVQFLRDFLPRNPDLPPPAESALKGPAAATQHALPLEHDQWLVKGGYKRAVGPLPLTTVRARLSALNLLHRQKGLLEPTMDPQFVREWKRFQRACRVVPRRLRRGVGELSKAEFDELLSSCQQDRAGVRDRAILLVAWSTALRCGQLVELRLESIQMQGNTPVIVVRAPAPRRNGLHGYRQNRSEPSLLTHKPLSSEAFAAVSEWRTLLASDGIHQGPLFWVLGDDRPRAPIGQEAIRDMFTRRASLAKVDLARATPDALRKGSLASQLRCGRPLQDLLKLAGLKKPASFMRI